MKGVPQSNEQPTPAHLVGSPVTVQNGEGKSKSISKQTEGGAGMVAWQKVIQEVFNRGRGCGQGVWGGGGGG